MFAAAAALARRRPVQIVKSDGHHEHQADEQGSNKKAAPVCSTPDTITASNVTATMVPHTLTRPGQIAVAPSNAPVKAGKR
jgi:hypothetical protein